MLDLSAIISVFNWWLIGSYRTGELIVSSVISFIEMLINAVKTLNTFTIILGESSTLWFEDIDEYFCAITQLIRNINYYLSETFTNFTSILSIVAKALFHTPLAIISSILTSIREIIMLLGSSCLFLISLPPLFLFHSIDTSVHAFKNFVYFVRYAAKRVTDHAADIQTLEVLLGLLVGCGLLVLTINGIKFLTKFYSEFKIVLLRTLRIIWRRIKKTSLTMIKRRRQRQRNEDMNSKFKATELCVICFENGRSVCFLPCRHLCLCVNCTESLSHPLRCPLCRQRTEDLIHVYL